MMTVGSLFSGVGGFDLGLERAGMRVLWQVEFDKQAQSVLRSHWPDVALHDDVRDVGRHNLGPVDLICGGFPCQDLSVAGRREGLAGERSGLFYEFMRIVDELAPRWVLIENVPGLLSSNGGRDMGAVVGTLGELGYWWTYRVVDSQYFGVAQRRRRVFIVGHLGAPCPPEILLEPEGLPGDTPPGREAREGVAGGVAVGVGGEGRDGFRMTAFGEYVDDGTASTVKARDYKDATDLVVHTLRAEGFDASEDGTGRGRGTPIVPHAFNWQGGGTQTKLGLDPNVTSALHVGQTPAVVSLQETGKRTGVSTDDPRAGIGIGEEGEPMYTLQAGEQHGVLAFDTTQVTSKLNRSNPQPGDPCHPLAAGAHPPAIAFNSKQAAEDAMVDTSPTLRAMPHDRSHANAGGQVAVYHIDRDKNANKGRAGTLQAHGTGGVEEMIAGPAIAILRRLTPKECERLQAFPDNWTRYGIEADGRKVKLADGPRYRMMGNAITVTVAEWIGHRIVAHAHRTATRQEAAA